MAAAGLMVVIAFKFDIFARVMVNAGGDGQSGAISIALSALILAGGSAAVYELLKRLGFRPPVEAIDDKPKPAETQAWISVRIAMKNAVGPVNIHIDKIEDPSADDQKLLALAGVVGVRPFRERLRGVFFADTLRYPTYGGRTVEANAVYRIAATGLTRSESGDDVNVPFEREVYRGRFASRAIIDLVQEI